MQQPGCTKLLVSQFHAITWVACFLKQYRDGSQQLESAEELAEAAGAEALRYGTAVATGTGCGAERHVCL